MAEYDTVQCVVCSKTMRVRDASGLSEPPLCSPDCTDKWDRASEARDNASK